MIIIKPDLVIKWANSNLVLHRVREHLCVFPVSPHIFTFLNILVMVLVSLNIYMRCACVCVRGKCCRGNAHIESVCLGMETAIIFLLAKRKKEDKKHTHTNIPPSILSLSRTHSLQLSPSLFLYHLQRQPFPPKWGHVRKVCKWNHCSWIRMGHHIP